MYNNTWCWVFNCIGDCSGGLTPLFLEIILYIQEFKKVMVFLTNNGANKMDIHFYELLVKMLNVVNLCLDIEHAYKLQVMIF